MLIPHGRLGPVADRVVARSPGQSWSAVRRGSGRAAYVGWSEQLRPVPVCPAQPGPVPVGAAGQETLLRSGAPPVLWRRPGPDWRMSGDFIRLYLHRHGLLLRSAGLHGGGSCTPVSLQWRGGSLVEHAVYAGRPRSPRPSRSIQEILGQRSHAMSWHENLPLFTAVYPCKRCAASGPGVWEMQDDPFVIGDESS